jgi:hypothetical protein
MKTLHHKLTLGIATLALIAASLGPGIGNGALARKVNEYEGQHRVAKVNEYEGQHRSVTGDPSQWG